MKILALIAISDVFLLIMESYIHAWRIRVKKKAIRHNPPMYGLLSLLGIIVLRMLQGGLVAHLSINHIALLASSLLLIMGLRVLIHDTFLNHLLENNIDYVGDGVDDAWTDKMYKFIWRRFRLRPIWARVIICAAFISLSIKIIQI